MAAPADLRPLPDVPASLLGESPLWHAGEGALYWCDIPGHRLERWHAASGEHRGWDFDTDVACAAPLLGGGLLLALRDGLWTFDPSSGRRQRLCDAPYDPQQERFNDGKADPWGRFWVSTLYEPRDRPAAGLYRFDASGLQRIAGNATVGNGLAWSPDGGTMYWADTQAHRIDCLDYHGETGQASGRRPLAQFPPKEPSQPLDGYGGRPDGAAVDSEGAYWVAMFEGARLLRLSPGGRVLQAVELPVRCPTMPCFGGPDLRTLFVTTARDKRPPEELARQPWAGCVLSMRVEVPGLPTHFAQLSS